MGGLAQWNERCSHSAAERQTHCNDACRGSGCAAFNVMDTGYPPMRITLSPEDYAAAFRILSANDIHHLNLAELVEDRVAPRLPAMPSLLDVDAGSGKVDRACAPRFPSRRQEEQTSEKT